uniref:Uncharacterized protein n=1 Tax=Anguilla anguilla TaxID=7936 RepID=A0A0E9RX29_ANGAN
MLVFLSTFNKEILLGNQTNQVTCFTAVFTRAKYSLMSQVQ